MNTAFVCLLVIAAAAAYPEVRERRSLLGAGLIAAPIGLSAPGLNGGHGIWAGQAAIAAPGILGANAAIAAPGIWGANAAIAAPGVWGANAAIASPAILGGHAAIAAPAVLAAGVPGGAVAGPSVVAGPSGVIKSSGAVAGPALGVAAHGGLLHG